MTISGKLADQELSKPKKSEEGEKKIITALGQLQKLGLTLTADVVHQVREQAQSQGLYNADSIKQLAKEYLKANQRGERPSSFPGIPDTPILNKTDGAPQLPEIITQDKPVSLSQDAAEKEKRTTDTNAGMHAFEIKGEENEHLPKDKEKAERLMKLRALVYAMRDEAGLDIKYARYNDPKNPVKPKTAEEVYIAKEGDCDDLSRLYVALAQEQLGITNFSQFYVTFRNETIGKEEGHAALFYVEGDVLYIDPGFEKAYVIHTKSRNIEEAVKDPEFRKDLEKCQFEATGKKDDWKVVDIKTINGQNSVEAVYCFEVGNYYSKINDWQNTSRYMSAAIEGGVRDFIAYLALGEAELKLGNYDSAIESLKAAKAINNNNSDCHAFLGLSYVRKEKPEYELAVAEFREQIRLEPNDYDAKYNLASACNHAGDQLMDEGKYKEALKYYEEAEPVLRGLLKSGGEADKQEILDTLESIKQMKKEAMKRLTK